MLIYRINTLTQGNAGGPPDELYIFRPGGTTTLTPGSIGSAYFSKNVGRTVINNVSNPPCFLSNNKPGGIAIYNIGEARGESITFEVDSDLINSELVVSPNDLTFANILIGETSEPQTITVSGKQLSYPLSYEISGIGSELFEIEKTSWNSYNGGTLSVTFTPDVSNKIYSVKVIFSAIGATSKSITLKGSGTTVAIDEQDCDLSESNGWSITNYKLRITN
jgi:hypothetical protein